jgi:PAS domain S-box-containing protein
MSPGRVDPSTNLMAGTTRVLQVDDEPDFLEMSATLLERTGDGLEVVTAEGGEEALEMLSDQPVDCIVSDYDMPGMDGLELLREVRQRYPGTPFILLTARGSEAVASEAISAGVDDYLQKGGGDEQYQLLANRVRNLVRQSRAETSYREIFENATVGLTVRDTETGELIDANQRYCDLLGYEKSELLELDFEDIAVVEEGYTSEEALEHIRAATEDDVETFEWLDRTKEGERLWVEVNLRLARIEGEQRVLASVRDITERKTHEQDLEETREYYETIAGSLPKASVAIYDADLTYEFVDGGVFDDLDLAPADLEGGRLEEVHRDSYVADHREDYEAAIDGETSVFEFEYEDRVFQGHTLPVVDDDDEVIAGMVVSRDVTDERERQRRLEQVASVLSHDLRNPLSVASGSVQLAIEDDTTEPLSSARTALERMDDIIDDALAMTGIADSTEAVDPTDLEAAAERAWETVETGAAELVVDDVGTVKADADGLRRLLENTFDNAVTHGDADVITVEATADGFAVADDGTGIPPDEHDEVLEMGYSTEPEGTGLGLAIVEAVADAHGWSVSVEESDDGGARVVVGGVESVAGS